MSNNDKRRIIDSRRRVWLAAPGWKIYDNGVFPDVDNLEEILELEKYLIYKNCVLRYGDGDDPGPINLPKDNSRQIVLPGPLYTESYARITDVLQKTTLQGQVLFYDFDPQFIYEGSGIKSPRYKLYIDFVSLPQYQGQAFLSFLNMTRGNYIFMYHFDKQKIMLYIAEDSIEIKNDGRNEFMEVSFEANCWDLE